MRRIPALDGLRGVAILLVVVYHGWHHLLPGGGYGVTIFFVLSGFLITSIISREIDDHGRLDFRRFYLRRAARLFPALIVVLTAYMAMGGDWGDTWPALAYVANWVQAGGGTMGAVSHTWSLAIEEHFYLIWPFLVGFIPNHRRSAITGGLLVAAVAWRVWMLADGATWERVYYGTDTVAFALLAGCWLAVTPLRLPPVRWAVPGLIISAFIVDASRGNFGSLWFGFVVVALSVAAIHTAVERGGWVLELPVLQWFGGISYGLYLWHQVIRRATDLPVEVAIGLSVLLAWMMWRSIEQPIMKWARTRVQAGQTSITAGPVSLD